MAALASDSLARLNDCDVPNSPTLLTHRPGGVLQADEAATRAWAWVWALVVAFTALRVAVLFTSPLELYPDEAQYWLWSRRLAWGYFSKPPMIAWLIAATTALGGNGEAWVRLSAPLLHGGAALATAAAAARLYGARAAPTAALVYALMPGVQLSSGVIATDAPLLFFLALALWAYAALWTARSPREALAAAAGLGTAMGLASLSKYAGLYYLLGVLAHAAASRRARALWTPARIAAALGLGLLILSPNLVWNAVHHFQTVAHTAADADWRDGEPRPHGGVDPRGPLGFAAGQFVVFGPVPFAALCVGAALSLSRRRRWTATDGLLAAFTLPPLLIVLAEAAVARANANWAAAAYVSGAVAAGAWLSRPGRGTWRAVGLGAQAVLAAAFLLAAADPALADRAGLGASLKRARGWRATTQEVAAYARRAAADGPVDAVAVDDRFAFNALSYYGAGRFGGTAGPPLRMWVHEARALNQAEIESPLTPATGGRVAFASLRWTREAKADFGRIAREETATVDLGGGRVRRVVLFEGLRFAPRPRPAVSARAGRGSRGRRP